MDMVVNFTYKFILIKSKLPDIYLGAIPFYISLISLYQGIADFNRYVLETSNLFLRPIPNFAKL